MNTSSPSSPPTGILISHQNHQHFHYLPQAPQSFLHLDSTTTFGDVHSCRFVLASSCYSSQYAGTPWHPCATLNYSHETSLASRSSPVVDVKKTIFGSVHSWRTIAFRLISDVRSVLRIDRSYLSYTKPHEQTRRKRTFNATLYENLKWKDIRKVPFVLFWQLFQIYRHPRNTDPVIYTMLQVQRGSIASLLKNINSVKEYVVIVGKWFYFRLCQNFFWWLDGMTRIPIIWHHFFGSWLIFYAFSSVSHWMHHWLWKAYCIRLMAQI